MIATILVIAVIALIFILCLKKIVTGMKNGECSGCGGNCSGCHACDDSTQRQTK